MDIYVFHDDTVPRPEFLLEDFKDTGDDITVGKVKMSIFYRKAAEGESIVMAGNSDGDAPVESRMYTVVAKKRNK